MTDRELMRQALDALDVATTPLARDRQEVLQAQAALRARLAQLNSATHSADSAESFCKPEPVAWTEQQFYEDGTPNPCALLKWFGDKAEDDFPIGTKFYTRPQTRKWIGLTDQEIEDLWNQHEHRFDYYSFSCDIEAKLKEKNT